MSHVTFQVNLRYFNKDHSFTIHDRNTQGLSTELHKMKELLSNEKMNRIFSPERLNKNLQTP